MLSNVPIISSSINYSYNALGTYLKPNLQSRGLQGDKPIQGPT